MFLFEITVECWVYIFLTWLFCSALKSKRIQLFQEMQPSLYLELSYQDSV